MSSAAPIGSPATPGGRGPAMLSHLAYVTPDAEGTVDFYTRVMRMELVLAVMDDKVPSTGAPFPYLHIFFRLGDGSTLAFFEALGLPRRNPTPHPAYEVFDHLALQVDSVAEVDAWHEHLVAEGLDVLGPVDHKIIYSIYFRDPINDLRLEITTPTDPEWNNRPDDAQDALADWIAAKKRAKDSGVDETEELTRVIKARLNNHTAVTDEVL